MRLGNRPSFLPTQNLASQKGKTLLLFSSAFKLKNRFSCGGLKKLYHIGSILLASVLLLENM